MMDVRRLATGVLLLILTSLVVYAQSSDERVLTLKSKLFSNTRSLRVLLPPGYSAASNASRRYPVFYFTDGVAAWDAWGVPATVRELWRKKTIPEFIFVGIDNGGSTAESKSPVRDRASEYLPYADQTWGEAPPEPKGDRFPRFFFDEVVPLVTKNLRVSSRPSCLGLAGSSYGAAVTLFTAITNPRQFGFVLLESPSLHIGERRLLREASAAVNWPARVYVGVGTAEGDTPEARRAMVEDARALNATLARAAARPHVLFKVVEGATHWYDAWRARLPAALSHLLGGDEAARCVAG